MKLLFRKLNYRVWEHGRPLCRVQAFKFESASDRMDVSELPVLWHNIFKVRRHNWNLVGLKIWSHSVRQRSLHCIL